MAPYRLYNRAFGGSTAEEALYYYPRLVRPAAPGAALLRGRQRHPYGLHAGGGLGTDPPGALLGPDRRGRTSAGGPPRAQACAGRAAFRPFQDEYNARLRAAAAEDPDTVYVDQAPFLEDEEGCVRTELYSDDQLHLNEAGYACVAEALKEALGRLGVRP